MKPCKHEDKYLVFTFAIKGAEKLCTNCGTVFDFYDEPVGKLSSEQLIEFKERFNIKDIDNG